MTDTRAGWVKYPNNPVLGGELGTVFDLSALTAPDGIDMWFSWRPRKSIAYTFSQDGVHWSEPQIELGPNEATDWEKDITAPRYSFVPMAITCGIRVRSRVPTVPGDPGSDTPAVPMATSGRAPATSP